MILMNLPVEVSTSFSMNLHDCQSLANVCNLCGMQAKMMYWHRSQQVTFGRRYKESTEDFIFQMSLETANTCEPAGVGGNAYS